MARSEIHGIPTGGKLTARQDTQFEYLAANLRIAQSRAPQGPIGEKQPIYVFKLTSDGKISTPEARGFFARFGYDLIRRDTELVCVSPFPPKVELESAAS
jgi:hypothetical protein